ncbi:MAG: C39 family peptidase [bacterium]|nr:C39 family peptidase [bacterium]
MDGNKKILPDVPYYSQWLDVKDADWQYRSCGVAAFKMAMLALRSPACQLAGRFNEEGDMSLDDLIKEGLASGAYKPGVGWVHDGLVALAKEHGFKNSFRKEWPLEGSPTSFSAGIAGIVSILEENIPVLASVKSETGGHIILLIGYEKEREIVKGFYYHDPDAKDRESGQNKFINKEDFLRFWKGRIIVVKK